MKILHPGAAPEHPLGPHIRGTWDANRIAAISLLALILPTSLFLFENGLVGITNIALAVILVMGWQLLFAILRHRAFTWDGVGTALIFTILAPPSTPLWQLIFAITFGVVLGEQIFGGRGRSFVNPATLALAFLFFSFHEPASDPAGINLIAAVVPGAILLLHLRLLSWRTLVGILLGLFGAAMLARSAFDWEQLLSGSLIFGLVFLACDPISSASTNLGRWLYGALIGTLVVVLGQTGAGPGSVNAVVFAALLGSIFAPLIDHTVVTLNAHKRRKRHG
jgi:Na+-transporting NADH:ubiquinone oxidoreductase subunit B